MPGRLQKTSLLLGLLLSGAPLFAQVEPDSSALDSQAFQLPPIFPGLAPQMIGLWEVEILSFNPLTTTKLTTQFEDSTFVSRFTHLTHQLQLNLGILRSRRLNVGLELQYNHARNDPDAGSSAARVLGNKDELTVRGFTGLGFRLRAMPFGTLPELTFQTLVVLPVGKSDELGRERIAWSLQASFYQRLLPWLTGFADAGVQIQFDKPTRPEQEYTPFVNVYFVGELWRNRLYIYPGITWSTLLKQRLEGAPLRTDINWTFNLGLQYNFTRNALLNFQWGRFIQYISSREAQRLEPGSFNSFSLGLRFLIQPQKPS